MSQTQGPWKSRRDGPVSVLENLRGSQVPVHLEETETETLGGAGSQLGIEVRGSLFSGSVMSSSFVTPWTVAHRAPVHGISQVRILECVAMSFPRGSSEPRDRTCISCIGCSFFSTESSGRPSIWMGEHRTCYGSLICCFAFKRLVV